MLYSIVGFPEFYVMFMFATKDALFMVTLDFLMVSNYDDEWRDFSRSQGTACALFYLFQ